MAAILSGSDLTDFNSLVNLEQQFAYIAAKLQVAQNQYNAANPTTPINRIAIQPVYTAGTLAIQANFEIETDAASEVLHNNVKSIS